MAKIIITSTINSVTVVFGEYSTVIETLRQTWSKRFIQNVRLHKDGTKVLVTITGEREWGVSFDGVDGTFKVDSINGEIPLNNLYLFNSLSLLIE